LAHWANETELAADADSVVNGTATATMTAAAAAIPKPLRPSPLRMPIEKLLCLAPTEEDPP
jgi:hypothetical protein